MLVIGLTGGIGSGKSTVAKLFAEKSVTIIDTDQLSRDVTKPGTETLKKIAAQFGTEILHKDGTLNRSKLRKIIFNDESKRLWLEKLLHPLIRAEVKRHIESAKPPYSIVIIPLLFETEHNPLIQRSLVVDTLEEQQIKRTVERDKLSREEVKVILKSQVNRMKRLNAADDVIVNTGKIEDLRPQVEKLHKFYLSLIR